MTTTSDGHEGERVQGEGGVSRRQVLGAAGIGVAASGLGGLFLPATATASPELWIRPSGSGAPPVSGLHLQFGADASREVVVSWQTAVPVTGPRVMFGTPSGGFGKETAAATTFYTD